MKVYFSHTGINNLLPTIEVEKKDTFIEVLNEINAMPQYTGIKHEVSLEGKVVSSARVFINVEVIETEINGTKYYKYYEKESTVEFSSLKNPIPADAENILFSIFDLHKTVIRFPFIISMKAEQKE